MGTSRLRRLGIEAARFRSARLSMACRRRKLPPRPLHLVTLLLRGADRNMKVLDQPHGDVGPAEGTIELRVVGIGASFYHRDGPERLKAARPPQQLTLHSHPPLGD